MATLAVPPSLALPRRADLSARRLDWTIILTVAGLCSIGLLAIYSATGPTRRLSGLDPYWYLRRQVLFVAAGVVVMAVASIIDYRRLREWAILISATTTVLLIAVTLLARTRDGARACST